LIPSHDIKGDQFHDIEVKFPQPQKNWFSVNKRLSTMQIKLLSLALTPALYLGVQAAFVPDTIPQRAPQADLRYQPALDFDTNGCYNVAVVGINAERAEGLPTRGIWPPQKDCREAWMLNKQNVYSRQRCNNGVCVHMYAYYFQKDTSGTSFIDAGGHTHDWEHVAVWSSKSDGSILAVSASAHGKYSVRAANQVRYDALGKPMIVYHKDGIGTHAFRFAENGDSVAENHWGAWIRAPLIGYHGWPSAWLRDTMYTWDFGSASLALTNEHFPSEISRAKPSWISFDINYDEPGTNEGF
jgi:hypothetical protein